MVRIGGRRCLCNVEYGASSLTTAWHPSKLLSTSIFWMIFVSGSWRMQQSFSFFNMFGWLPVVCCCRWSAWRSPSHSYEIIWNWWFQSFPNPHSFHWHRVALGAMGYHGAMFRYRFVSEGWVPKSVRTLEIWKFATSEANCRVWCRYLAMCGLYRYTDGICYWYAAYLTWFLKRFLWTFGFQSCWTCNVLVTCRWGICPSRLFAQVNY